MLLLLTGPHQSDVPPLVRLDPAAELPASTCFVGVVSKAPWLKVLGCVIVHVNSCDRHMPETKAKNMPITFIV